MYSYALHPDVLSFLTIKDAVKLRLANKECLEACSVMNWNDRITPVKNLEKWKRCFPRSIALYYHPTIYAHEHIFLGGYVNSNGLNHIFNDGVVDLESLVLPNIVTSDFSKNPWPLYTSACFNLKHLSITLDTNTLHCIFESPSLCASLLKLECKENSRIKDKDILQFSFDSKGSLQIKNVFWARLMNLREFDCSRTTLSHAILDGFPSGNLKILRVNKTFFNTEGVEALRAKKMGIQITYVGSKNLVVGKEYNFDFGKREIEKNGSEGEGEEEEEENEV